MSYTGIGRIANTDLSDWIRGFLRGESRTLQATLAVLRNQATKQLGKTAAQLGVQHSFILGLILDGQPFFGVVTNIEVLDLAKRQIRIKESFSVHTRAVNNGIFSIVGGGGAAVSTADRDLLRRVSVKRPRRPEQFRSLLAEVNRRAAESSQRAARVTSRSSVTSFMPPAVEPFQHGEHYWEKDQGPSPAIPLVHLGIDTTEWTRVLLDSADKLHTGEMDKGTFDRLVREAAERSVRPTDKSGR